MRYSRGRMSRLFFVYLMASKTRVLYAGVTNDIERRVYEHKTGKFPGFTSQYYVKKLVYYEEARSAATAIARETEIKRWTRAKKVPLIQSTNPEWHDLAKDWYASNF